MKNDLYTIRDYDETEDKNFIVATCLRNLFYSSPVFANIPKDTFMANYHNVVIRLLEESTVKIACMQEDPSIILGYVIYKQPETDGVSVLDFIFVKQMWRKIGIAKALMPKNVVAVTHITKQGLSMLPTKLPGAVYNPFLNQ